MSTVYLNGEFLPLAKARVSVLDRGFTFADGVYEVIPVFNGRIFRLQAHLARLDNSLKSIHIANPYSEAAWTGLLEELLAKNPSATELSLYMQVTRGVGEREHVYPASLEPTVFLMCRAVQSKDPGAGVTAVTHPDIRWQYCHIKAIALLPGVLLKQYARQADGSIDAILIRDAYVTEGATTNVFIVKDGIVKTPVKDGKLLAGVTRDLVIELLQDAGLACEETSISEDELHSADEIWLTSSSLGIAPVVGLDGKAVGNGKAGDLWKQANQLYLDYKTHF